MKTYEKANYKYVKKPIEIEAFQMTKERQENNVDWPEWLVRAWQLNRTEVGSVHPTVYPTKEGNSDRTLSIKTLEGEHLVSWNDFIIQGILGILYPCKPDIFLESYDQSIISDEGFEIGNFYKHTMGQAYHICGYVDSKAWGRCLVAEDEREFMSPVGTGFPHADGWTEITENEWLEIVGLEPSEQEGGKS